MSKKIKVVVADDHQIIIDGIKLMIEKHEDIEVVGEALNGKALLALLDTKYTDIAIVDINMPEMDGITAAQHIAKTYPHVKVLILTMHNEKNHILSIVEAGAKGYILKNKSTDDVVNAIYSIADDKTYFDPKVVDILLNEKVKARSATAIKLTKREIDVLRLIPKELTSAEIGEKLKISKLTVDAHRRNLMYKLKVKSVVGLVKYAMENGYA